MRDYNSRNKKHPTCAESLSFFGPTHPLVRGFETGWVRSSTDWDYLTGSGAHPSGDGGVAPTPCWQRHRVGVDGRRDMRGTASTALCSTGSLRSPRIALFAASSSSLADEKRVGSLLLRMRRAIRPAQPARAAESAGQGPGHGDQRADA